jgi:hypothetical protein
LLADGRGSPLAGALVLVPISAEVSCEQCLGASLRQFVNPSGQQLSVGVLPEPGQDVMQVGVGDVPLDAGSALLGKAMKASGSDPVAQLI